MGVLFEIAGSDLLILIVRDFFAALAAFSTDIEFSLFPLHSSLLRLRRAFVVRVARFGADFVRLEVDAAFDLVAARRFERRGGNDASAETVASSVDFESV